MIIGSFRWLIKKQVQPHVKPTVLLEPPPGIHPLEAGRIVDECINRRDVAAMVLYWASHGLIKIEEKYNTRGQRDFILVKIDDLPKTSPHYEECLFFGIFTKGTEVVRVSHLVKIRVHKALDQMAPRLEEEMQKSGWYKGKKEQHPKRTKLARTDKGEALVDALFAFYDNLKHTSPSDLEYQLKNDPDYFSRVFPFVVALGLTKRWLRMLRNTTWEKPAWFKTVKNQGKWDSEDDFCRALARMIRLLTFAIYFASYEVHEEPNFTPSSRGGGGSSSGGGSGGTCGSSGGGGGFSGGGGSFGGGGASGGW